MAWIVIIINDPDLFVNADFHNVGVYLMDYII